MIALTSLRSRLCGRRRLALEINDGIVQGLVRAKWALEARREDEAQAAVEQTLAEAQAVVTRLMGDRCGPRAAVAE